MSNVVLIVILRGTILQVTGAHRPVTERLFFHIEIAVRVVGVVWVLLVVGRGVVVLGNSAARAVVALIPAVRTKSIWLVLVINVLADGA
jgi:hypothetical protein